MIATVKRIAAKSGNRDNDYFQAVCVCGWSGAFYSNRTVEGRSLAAKHASQHRCAVAEDRDFYDTLRDMTPTDIDYDNPREA